MIIDTHTHLYVEQFDDDLSEVLDRAKELGVNKFVLPSIDLSYGNRLKALIKKNPNVFYGMIGLHPTSVKPETVEQELLYVEEELKTKHYHAIGEIGVDLYWDKTHRDLQMDVFGHQIQLAKNESLPFAIHCRNSFPEIFEVLEKNHYPELKGVLHCFSGDLADAKRAIALGLHLGIGGVVTFKNGKIDRFLQEVDLNHIVLETDAPYLAPAPNRGKRNEPSFLRFVIQRLSEIYALPPEEIERITTENAKSLFCI